MNPKNHHLVLQECFASTGLERRSCDVVIADPAAPIWAALQRSMGVGPGVGVELDASSWEVFSGLFPVSLPGIDLQRFQYQLGIAVPSAVRADGYVLRRRSEMDGTDLAVFTGDAAQLLPLWSRLLAPGDARRYESVFVSPAARADVLQAYDADAAAGEDCFYELHPFLLAHRQYYLDQWGVDITRCIHSA